LKNARHPLLERRLRAESKRVVPVSLELAGADRQLIISGPNTGGKTVTLKTAGLLAIMAQAGVPVPADELVSPVFDAFLADIGDAQSIEQDLSTFSAHVTNLNRIAAQATSRSLVLLDELGSATDPEEGAALAVAVAEHFLNAGAWSIVSTHLTSLKVYAESAPGAVNAAVGFDEKTLAPTYELRQGVPGTSAGINIAQRLGLNATIISAARQRLSTQTQDIGRFLDSLHEQLASLTKESVRVRRLEQDLAQERARLDAEGMKEWRAKVRDLEGQLQSLLKNFEYQMRETVRSIEDRAAQQKLSKQAEQRIARLRREFSESFNTAVVAQHTGADRGDQNAQPHIVRHVSEGDTVRLRTLGRQQRCSGRSTIRPSKSPSGDEDARCPRRDRRSCLRRRQANADPGRPPPRHQRFRRRTRSHDQRDQRHRQDRRRGARRRREIPRPRVPGRAAAHPNHSRHRHGHSPANAPRMAERASSGGDGHRAGLRTRGALEQQWWICGIS
jgi:DNA mismatch repair protein MutS2